MVSKTSVSGQSETRKAHNEKKVKPSHETDNERGDNGANGDNSTIEQRHTSAPRLSLFSKIISTDGNGKASGGSASETMDSYVVCKTR